MALSLPAPSPGQAHTSNSSETKIKLAGEEGWHGKALGVGVGLGMTPSFVLFPPRQPYLLRLVLYALITLI